jgi:hypothetical protein
MDIHNIMQRVDHFEPTPAASILRSERKIFSANFLSESSVWAFSTWSHSASASWTCEAQRCATPTHIYAHRRDLLNRQVQKELLSSRCALRPHLPGPFEVGGERHFFLRNSGIKQSMAATRQEDA